MGRSLPEADPTVALLCRELVVLSRLVADAEARREARLEEKLAELDARIARLSGRSAPRPLDIPRGRARAEPGSVERLRESFEAELERE